MRRRTRPAGHAIGQKDLADDRQFVTALDRGLEVLRAFRPEDLAGLSNRELSERTHIPNSTLSRLTYTLMQSGYLIYDHATGRYRLGARVLSLGYACLSGMPFRAAMQNFLQALADECGEGIHVALAERIDDQMIYVAVARAPGVVSVQADIGLRVSMVTTAVGLAYLAGCSDEERRQVIDDIKSGCDECTAKSRIENITMAMEEIIRQGFCTSFGQWRSGVNSIAVPLVNPDKQQRVQSIVIGGPSTHVTPAHLTQFCGPRLLELCQVIQQARL